MAAIAKSGVPSIATALPPQNEQIPGIIAGENISAGDICRIGTDGRAVRAVGQDAVHGVAAFRAQTGQAVTLYRNVRFGYGAGLTPSTAVYLSGTAAGGLDDAATYVVGTTTFNATRLGFVVDAERIQFRGL